MYTYVAARWLVLEIYNKDHQNMQISVVSVFLMVVSLAM